MNYRSLQRTAILGVLLALSGASPVAWGQCVIPEETVKAPVLNETQKSEVRRCAEENARDLDHAEPDKRKNARRLVLTPIENPAVSASFRVEYGNQLAPRLTALVRSGDERIATLGLAIAGEIGSEPCVPLLLQNLKADRPALRYAAAFGMRRTFDATRGTGGASVQSATVLRMVESLAEQAKAEKDGLVLQAIVAALQQASRVPSNVAASAAASSVQAISSGMGGNLKSRNGAMADTATNTAFLKAVVAIRDALAAPGMNVDEATGRAAAEFAGHVVAYPALALQNQSLPDGAGEPRNEAAEMSAAAQTLIQFVGSSLRQGFQLPAGLDLKRKLLVATRDGDAKFVLDARGIAGSEGVLTKPPFGFAANTFGLK